jgi:hypothetical protein
MADRYPKDGPLASRRAPRHSERRHLFLANGEPHHTPAQRELLKRADKHQKGITNAHQLLLSAIQRDDPHDASLAVRSLLSISLFLNDYIEAK